MKALPRHVQGAVFWNKKHYLLNVHYDHIYINFIYLFLGLKILILSELLSTIKNIR